MNQTQIGMYSLLQIYRALEGKKIGGLGNPFNIKEFAQTIQGQGEDFIMNLKRDLRNTEDAIGAALRNLKDELSGMSRSEIAKKVEEVVTEVINSSLGISVEDFYIQKAIVNGDFDDEEIGYFLSLSSDRANKMSKRSAVVGRIKNSKRGTRFPEGYFDEDYDDFIDVFLFFLVMDFYDMGIIDTEMVNMSTGMEEDFLVAEAEIEVDTTEAAEEAQGAIESDSLASVDSDTSDRGATFENPSESFSAPISEPEPDRSYGGGGGSYEDSGSSFDSGDSGGSFDSGSFD